MSEVKCGIYEIRCSISGKRYIGSSCSIHSRWSQHRRALRAGKHNSPRLQKAWNKHGENCFVFSVIEECARDRLFPREQWHIDRLRPDYNSMRRVRVVSAEMRAKMNASMRAIAEQRTHCPHGHEYTPENSYLSKSDGSRICRACNRARVAKVIASETPDQTAARLKRSNDRYHANYAETRAKQNAYAAANRDRKRAYDVAYRPIKNARRRQATQDR